ncbi:MAG: ParB/RepB/Spo0J family partition protein [Treponema sp.]|jgi:ParB/RepB/Spo0J family partition protein|nr:ParB/RepB/Spo0J family partition protein [Treponema sp.]
MKTIKLSTIICESNRKYTKDEGFEQLLNSIKQYGIIEPPVLRELENGNYKVIAGRRRIEAARQAGYTEADCIVKAADDPLDDEEVALTENVNRQEMHPLDEAAVFKRMADEGNPVEEIARYYARSPSAIYKRLRLASLIEELKGWFRDRFLNISGAAILAELPEEDQRAFFEEHKEECEHTYDPEEDDDVGPDYYEIDNSKIIQFVFKRQRFKVRNRLGEECQACEKRTHNSGNELFEEYDHLDDVCLDGDCYRKKWHEVIQQALTAKIAENGPATDMKILFSSNVSDCILKHIYKKATHIEIAGGHFEVLREKNWEFTGATDRKKGACWEIRAQYGTGDVYILIQRIGYKEKKAEEKTAASAKGKSGDNYLASYFGKDASVAFAAERGMTPAQLGQMLEDKKQRFNFTSDDIGNMVLKRLVANHIEREQTGEEPPRNYFDMYMRFIDKDFCKLRGKEEKELFQKLTGKNSMKDISIPDELQGLFHFLLVYDESDFGQTLGCSVPNINNDITSNLDNCEKIFMEYADLDNDAYHELWLQCARELLNEILKPKEKPGKKKPEKSGGAHGESGPANESSAGSSTSKRKGKGAKAQENSVRKCWVCGCTDDDCRQCIEKTGNPCHWVEEDLCSCCADEASMETDDDESQES